MSNHHVLIATPSYDNKVTSEYMGSVMDYVINTTKNVSYYIYPNDSLVTRARNELFASFYENIEKKQFTHILFQDSDIYMQSFGLERMLNFEVDVIGAAVPLKTKENYYGITCAVANVYEEVDSMLYKAQYVGSGILMFSKKAVYDLVEYCEDTDNWYHVPGQKRKIYNVFSTGINKDKIYQSEDWYICDTLSNLGYDLHVDSGANVSHMNIRRKSMLINPESINRKYTNELLEDKKHEFWTPNDWIDITVTQEFYT